MSSNPLISIIVLNWNGEKIFPACLNSLAQLEYHPYEVLFVDNGSTDESIRLAGNFPGITIVDNKENLGYAAGNNRAMQFIGSGSKYVCFLNNDIVVSPSWLNDAVLHLERDSRIGVIACRNMHFFDPGKIDGLYHCFERFFTIARFGRGLPYIEHPLYNEPGYVLSALGASAIYRTELFTSLGGFDESFFAYYEDTDFCMRINNSGHRCLYVPSAVVFHHDQASFGKNSKQSYYYSERNRLFFLRKNFPIGFLRNHWFQFLLEDARMLKSCLQGRNNFKLFLKARLDSMVRLKNYRPPGKGSFDEAFIAEVMERKKIPL